MLEENLADKGWSTDRSRLSHRKVCTHGSRPTLSCFPSHVCMQQMENQSGRTSCSRVLVFSAAFSSFFCRMNVPFFVPLLSCATIRESKNNNCNTNHHGEAQWATRAHRQDLPPMAACCEVAGSHRQQILLISLSALLLYSTAKGLVAGSGLTTALPQPQPTPAPFMTPPTPLPTTCAGLTGCPPTPTHALT